MKLVPTAQEPINMVIFCNFALPEGQPLRRCCRTLKQSVQSSEGRRQLLLGCTLMLVPFRSPEFMPEVQTKYIKQICECKRSKGGRILVLGR